MAPFVEHLAPSRSKAVVQLERGAQIHPRQLSAGDIDALLDEAQDRAVFAFEIIISDASMQQVCLSDPAYTAFQLLSKTAKHKLIKLDDREQVDYLFIAVEKSDAVILKLFLD